MKKILISRTDGIGDLILATPVIKEIKAALKCHVTLMISEYSRDVLANNPDVDEIIIFDKHNLSGVIRRVKEAGFDAAVTLFPEFGASYVPFAAGVPLRYGTARRWYSPLFFNKRVNVSRAGSQKHEAEYNLMLAKDLIGDKQAQRAFWYLTAAEKEAAAQYIKEKALDGKFIMVYPGGKSAANMSEHRYAQVIELLHAHMGLPVLLACGKGELGKVKRIFNSLKSKGNTFIMDEELNLRALAALIGSAAVFMSCSTGPMHIAGALGTATLSFFPAKGVSPVRWKPLGSMGIILAPQSESAGMDSIGDEEIILSLREILL